MRETAPPMFIAGQMMVEWEMQCIFMRSMRVEPDSEAFFMVKNAIEQTYNKFSHAIFGNEMSDQSEAERCEFLRTLGMKCDREYGGGGGAPGHHHVLEPTPAYTEFFDGHVERREADEHTLSVDRLSIVGSSHIAVIGVADSREVTLRINGMHRADDQYDITVPVGGVFVHERRTWAVVSAEMGTSEHGFETPVVKIRAIRSDSSVGRA
ncbi:hypothetical protein [Aeromicrobium sp. 179-A 4D2 NHS]|uniref:hypothetical protein n=1 Tax=Aeromicrobium sp. 179-A 4D2 NHS TaxID=3142375 RepID=UPI0039A17332